MRTVLTAFAGFTLLSSACCGASDRTDAHDFSNTNEVHINLFRPPGAMCTFHRDGVKLVVRQAPRTNPDLPDNGFEGDWIDVSTSHSDIVLTCRTLDGWQESQTLTYGPYEYDNFLAACGPPVAGGQSCSPAIRMMKAIGYGYQPGTVHMRREAAQAPQP